MHYTYHASLDCRQSCAELSTEQTVHYTVHMFTSMRYIPFRFATPQSVPRLSTLPRVNLKSSSPCFANILHNSTVLPFRIAMPVTYQSKASKVEGGTRPDLLFGLVSLMSVQNFTTLWESCYIDSKQFGSN
jgi:hypothetical protein